MYKTSKGDPGACVVQECHRARGVYGLLSLDDPVAYLEMGGDTLEDIQVPYRQ